MSERDDKSNDQTESTYSGEFGERNRNTPGRTPRELGLDPDEMRGHNAIGNSSDRTGDVSFTASEAPHEQRKNPPLTPDVEQMGEGGLSMSGGRAGGAENGPPSQNREPGSDDDRKGRDATRRE